jgi:hypothetical protein
MDLLQYMYSNNLVLLLSSLFLGCVIIITDLYDANKKFEIDASNYNITNFLNNTNTINISECNYSLENINYYKNINIFFGISLLLFNCINFKMELYRIINIIKLYLFVFLIITYIYGFSILLISYLYDCYEIMINIDSYNIYSFIINYSIFILFGIMYLLDAFGFGKLLSCSCFVTRPPPSYDVMDNKLPDYEEIENENDARREIPPPYPFNV